MRRRDAPHAGHGTDLDLLEPQGTHAGLRHECAGDESDAMRSELMPLARSASGHARDERDELTQTRPRSGCA